MAGSWTKFIVELDIDEGYFNKEELSQLEAMLERTITSKWDINLAKQMGVTSKKLLKFWECGCFVNVNFIN